MNLIKRGTKAKDRISCNNYESCKLPCGAKFVLLPAVLKRPKIIGLRNIYGKCGFMSMVLLISALHAPCEKTLAHLR